MLWCITHNKMGRPLDWFFSRLMSPFLEYAVCNSYSLSICSLNEQNPKCTFVLEADGGMDEEDEKIMNEETNNHHRSADPQNNVGSWIPKLAAQKQKKKKTWCKLFRQMWADWRGVNPTEELETLKQDMQVDEHMLTIMEVCERYRTSPNLGLLKAQAEGRLKRYGANKMEPPPLETEWKKLLKKIFRRFSILLWASSMLCFVSYFVEWLTVHQATPDNMYLGIVLIFAVIIAGSFQYFQERRTRSLLDSFKKLIPSRAKVWRDGQLQVIPSEQLVIGDVVDLRPGDKVPADLRIIQSSGLKADNSTLTGETEFQSLDINCTNFNPWETANLAFFPTVVMEGRGKGVVIRTGDNTVMANIAGLAEIITRPETPISKEVLHFIHVVTIVSGAFGVLFFFIAIAFGEHWITATMLLIGLLVANAPEGILATVMACLNLTAKKMAQKNCVVKHLEAVETLGSVNAICVDKTGTLTCNRMTVSHLWYNGKTINVERSSPGLPLHKVLDLKDPVLLALLRVGCLCNSASFCPGQEDLPVQRREVTGGPTDTGIMRFAEEALGDVERTRGKNKKVFDVPFNSVNKFKLTINQNENFDESYMIISLKGAPENIVGMCSTVFLDGKDEPLSEELRMSYSDACLKLASDGERIVGLCDYRLPHSEFPPSYEFDEGYAYPTTGYRLLGLISMVDPLRPGVPSAVERCRKAGIKVIMITGDHPNTAKSVAKSAGIISAQDDIIEYIDGEFDPITERNSKALLVHGKQLQDMKRDQLDYILGNWEELVFARTTPQQKLLIVEGCQRLGSIVAVTGDGVNDSPALKQGDIGIAMGITGNDVCKRAADIVLLDDNFVSVVVGVEEAMVVLRLPLALGTVCVLCVDLGTDAPPAISLAYEHAEFDLMSRPCRDHRVDRLVNRRTFSFRYGMVGTIQAAAGFFAYFVVYAENGFLPTTLIGIRDKWISSGFVTDTYGQQWSYDQRKQLQYAGYTAYFVAIVVVQWADALISKNRFKSIVTQPMNWTLNTALVVETVLAGFLVYCPGLNTSLYFEPLKFFQWFPALPFAILVFCLDELRRYLIRRSPGGFLERETYY